MFGLSSMKQKCVMPCNEEVPKLKAVGVWENDSERCLHGPNLPLVPLWALVKDRVGLPVVMCL